jgi:hypothetical protein
VWLKECKPPFWGRSGTRKVVRHDLYRQTELNCQPIAGIRPKSVFQIYGPGAVGTGSLRGMPLLCELHDADFSIWPFDPPGWPKVVEIYPRAFTGPVVKRDREARRAYLADWALPPWLGPMAEGSDDAFDAAISALVMSRHSQELMCLRQATDPTAVLEGEIWRPHGADQAESPVAVAEFPLSLGPHWLSE